jgi:glucans biosynthesis protein
VVDFTGKELNKVPADAVLRAVITIGSNTDGSTGLLEQQVLKNPVTGGWRLVFQVRPEDEGPLELRAFLQQKDKALTETWSYAVEP